MNGLIKIGSAVYKELGYDSRLLISITGEHEHFKVPSEVFTTEGKRYRITGISSYFDLLGIIGIISFDDASEITGVPLSFIEKFSRSVLVLPPKVKRILGSNNNSNSIYLPKIVCEASGRRFFSILGRFIIMNHFPLEIVRQLSPKHRCIIRETVRFIGGHTFCSHLRIRTVVFPSSVESIGSNAFGFCINLRHIIFKKNSKLKIIGESSFQCTSIEYIDIPSNVEEIGGYAFGDCRKLKIITFQKDSKLKIIGRSSFQYTSIECIDIPSNVEEIRKSAFISCKFLRFITFQEDSKLKKIGSSSFFKTAIESIFIPSNVEEIKLVTFGGCNKLKSVTFHEDSKLKKIGVGSFNQTAIESIDIPSSVELIDKKAFACCQCLRSVRYLCETKKRKIDEDAFSCCPNLQ